MGMSASSASSVPDCSPSGCESGVAGCSLVGEQAARANADAAATVALPATMSPRRVTVGISVTTIFFLLSRSFARYPHHALLGNAGKQHAVTTVDPAQGESAAAAGGGGLLNVEHPLVHPPETVPPHGVVQACHLDSGCSPGNAVASEDGLEQRIVAHIGEGRTVQVAVVW